MSDAQKRTNYFDLKRDETMALNEYIKIPESDRDIKSNPPVKKINISKRQKGKVSLKKSQSTGSFLGDLKKAITAGGSSKLTKKVKVKKGDTLSDIAKANNTSLKMLMQLNPKFKTGQGPSGKYVGPISKGTTQQKEMRIGSNIIVPDPQSFQGGRLKPVRTKKKTNVYKKVTKPEFKEMSQKIPNPTLKRGAVTMAMKKKATKKKMTKGYARGGKISKMRMGGSKMTKGYARGGAIKKK